MHAMNRSEDVTIMGISLKTTCLRNLDVGSQIDLVLNDSDLHDCN